MQRGVLEAAVQTELLKNAKCATGLKQLLSTVTCFKNSEMLVSIRPVPLIISSVARAVNSMTDVESDACNKTAVFSGVIYGINEAGCGLLLMFRNAILCRGI